MTREEAVAVLKTYDMSEDNEDREFIEALQMAISALEQEPCDDAISRQAVQDAIEDWLMSDDFDKRDLVQRLHGRINELPSVQPKRDE